MGEVIDKHYTFNRRLWDIRNLIAQRDELSRRWPFFKLSADSHRKRLIKILRDKYESKEDWIDKEMS